MREDTESAGTPAARDADDENVLLMRRVAAGDFSAMRALVEKWQRPLINFFYRSVRSAHTAEDLAQTTFVKIYRSAGTYEARAKFSSWLFFVARTVLISNFRKEALRPAEATDPAELPAVAAETAELETDDLERAFDEAVKSLPENQRTAILLLRQQELSYEEIAAAMDANVQNVKTWIFRARRALRERLAEFLEK